MFASHLRINICNILFSAPYPVVGLFDNHHLRLTEASLMKVEHVLISVSLIIGSLLYIYLAE